MIISFSLWQYIGFAVSSIGGIFLHYLYKLTSDSVIVAPFSAVNESTWEHMKLLFFPSFIFAITESVFIKENENFWYIKLIGIFVGLLLIPILFYTLNGVFGSTPDLINIAIFFVSLTVSFTLETRLYKSEKIHCGSPAVCLILLCVIALLFSVFTFFTPKIPLFEDPSCWEYYRNIHCPDTALVPYSKTESGHLLP